MRPLAPVAAAAVLSAAAAVTAVGTAGTAGAYRSGAPPAHTGGFGEPLCSACHAPDTGQPPGTLEVHVPGSVHAGEAVEVRVVLRDPDMEAAGFQLAARFGDGDRAGEQAGELATDDEGVVVLSARGIQYAGHREEGTRARAGSRTWTLRWRAPDAGGDVVFHAAANAANDDDSEFGDRVYHSTYTVRVTDQKDGLEP